MHNKDKLNYFKSNQLLYIHNIKLKIFKWFGSIASICDIISVCNTVKDTNQEKNTLKMMQQCKQNSLFCKKYIIDLRNEIPKLQHNSNINQRAFDTDTLNNYYRYQYLFKLTLWWAYSDLLVISNTLITCLTELSMNCIPFYWNFGAYAFIYLHIAEWRENEIFVINWKQIISPFNGICH